MLNETKIVPFPQEIKEKIQLYIDLYFHQKILKHIHTTFKNDYNIIQTEWNSFIYKYNKEITYNYNIKGPINNQFINY